MKALAPLAAATAALACFQAAAQVPLSMPAETKTVHTPESLSKAAEEKAGKAAAPPSAIPPAVAHAENGAPNTAEGKYLPKWVLLRNGRMQFGEVMKDSAGYLFRSNGARMRFSETQVEAVADTKTDIFRYKRNRIAANDLDERVELARWCLVHLLIVEAKSEVKAVLAIDPQFEPARKLFKNLEHPESPFAPQQETKAPIATSGIASDAAGFGDEAIHLFTSQVQLILLNKCGKCHSNPRYETEFRLSDRRSINKANTSRNFKAAEAMVDLRNPGKSKLLEMAITPHGGDKVVSAPFGGPNDEGFKALRKWSYMLAKNWQEAFADPEGMPQIAQGNLPDLPARRPAAQPTKKSTAVASKMKAPPDKPGFGSGAADDAPPQRPSLMNAPKKVPAKHKQEDGDPLDPAGFNETEGSGAGGATRQDAAPKSAPEAPKQSARPSNDNSSSADLYKDVYEGTPASWKTNKKSD